MCEGVVPGRGGAAGGVESFVSEVLEEREVDDEDADTEDSSDDVLSGTLGLGGFPIRGDLALFPSVVGVPAVGVLD